MCTLLSNILVAQTKYKPTITFDLTTVPGAPPLSQSTIEKIAVGEADIYLWYRPRIRAGHHGLIRVSRLGSIISSSQYLIEPSPFATTLDKAGRVYALIGFRDRTVQVHQYSASGLVETGPSIAPVESITFAGSTPILLDRDGTLHPAASGSTGLQRPLWITQPPPRGCHFIGLDDNTVAIVDRLYNSLRIIDLAAGTERVAHPDAPEILEVTRQIDQIVAKPHPGEMPITRPTLFYDAASDGKGNLYLAVAPGRLADGVQLVHISRSGQYVRSLRLLPASLPGMRQSANPDGWVLQRTFSIAGSMIATASAEGVVSVFALE